MIPTDNLEDKAEVIEKLPRIISGKASHIQENQILIIIFKVHVIDEENSGLIFHLFV